jgi:hypothetical protein
MVTSWVEVGQLGVPYEPFIPWVSPAAKLESPMSKVAARSISVDRRSGTNRMIAKPPCIAAVYRGRAAVTLGEWGWAALTAAT